MLRTVGLIEGYFKSFLVPSWLGKCGKYRTQPPAPAQFLESRTQLLDPHLGFRSLGLA
jgi:hypothetical protein